MKFVLVLHSHLPWVLHHGRWPHGSDWLSEAVLDTYLPLIGMLDRAEATGRAVPMTIGITPILAAQLAHPSCREEVEHYFDHRFETLGELPQSLRETGDEELLHLVSFWRKHLSRLRGIWEQHGKDLIGAFRGHAEAGRIELISSAATHGFLPLLARDESIRFQLMLGRAEHIRHFGEAPKGCWVPECAYRPRGPWQPLPQAPPQAVRPGVEEHLRRAGFQWFVVDSHLADAGEAWELYEGKPIARQGEIDPKRSPYRAYHVGAHPPPGQRPVTAVVRDPAATKQVWSRHGGYPGDSRYLEFHKIRYPGGLKFWRVTDPAADLGMKEPYLPGDALDAAAGHARHFVDLLKEVAAGRRAGDVTITAPFDTELFGHWWFEGVDFVQDVFDRLPAGDQVAPSTASRMLNDDPPTSSIRMGEGSWGANGDFSKWLNPETEWTWLRLWPLENRFWDVVPAAIDRDELSPILEQAARELLLAQGSDWQFIISTGAAGDYATKRFTDHCDALESLLNHLDGDSLSLDEGLALAAQLREVDDPFPDLRGALAAASDVPVE